MTRITITENGRETVVTDITRFVEERDGVLANLQLIYRDFEKGTLGALDAREQEIVNAVNRYNELQHVIDTFETASVRRANILAGWEIVKQHRSESGT